jgi:hypothetical protein
MLFVTFTTGNYAAMTDNMLINFRDVLVQYGHTIALFCMDELAYEKLKSYTIYSWITVHLEPLNTESMISTFNTPSFNKLNSFKPLLLRRMLDTHEEVYWIDSDLVFYRDPEPFVRATESKDIIFQQDNPRDEDRVCTGNFYIKSTPQTKEFFNMWIRELELNPGANEQLLLNAIVYKEYGSVFTIPWISVDVFPPEKFQRGLDAFQGGWWSREDTVVVHANFMCGFETKKNAIASIHMWKSVME